MTTTAATQTPIEALAALGIDHTPWANGERVRTDSSGARWDYRASVLTSRCIQDLARLTLEGWPVFVGTDGDGIRISIRAAGARR